MNTLSVLIPSYNEPYLAKTINDLLKKASGDIEILVNLDGDKPDNLVSDHRVRYFYHPNPLGMRGGINVCLKNATGQYIMKTDAHCIFAKGFDETLKKDSQKNWLIIPRRFSLDPLKWQRMLYRPIRDYHYFEYPGRNAGYIMSCTEWTQRTIERMNNPKYPIDDTMTMQGSCWFADREYFLSRVGFLDDRSATYSTFAGDQLEIAAKYWLFDGEVKVDKNCWYAHLFKNRYFYDTSKQSRYNKKSQTTQNSYRWAAEHWLNNKEPGTKRKFSWLIEKFWPVPGWPEDRKLWVLK